MFCGDGPQNTDTKNTNANKNKGPLFGRTVFEKKRNYLFHRSIAQACFKDLKKSDRLFGYEDFLVLTVG